MSAAGLAAQFMSTVMLDSQTGLAISVGTLGNGTVACNISPSSTLYPDAMGQYIEGLAVLADVDTSGATQWTQLFVAHCATNPRAADQRA
jgi:hypothetical protein